MPTSSNGGLILPGFVTVGINKLYSISLPGYLEKTSALSTTASLQYSNLNKKLLVIVIVEDKSTTGGMQHELTILTYYEQVANQIAQKLEDAFIEKPSSKLVGDCRALQGGINGKFLGTDLRYIVQVVESETRYYQVICWTEERALQDLSHDIDVIINSFIVFD